MSPPRAWTPSPGDMSGTSLKLPKQVTSHLSSMFRLTRVTQGMAKTLAVRWQLQIASGSPYHAQLSWSGSCCPMVTCKCRAGYCADNTQYGGGRCAGGPHCHHGTRPPALHWLSHPSQAPLWLWLPGLHQAFVPSLPAAIATLSIMPQTHPGDYSSGNMHGVSTNSVNLL